VGKIQIGSKSFDSKKSAKDYVRGIMARYRESEIIGGTDDTFMRDLLSCHPEASQKTGAGVAHFTTRPDPVWRTSRHFVVVRVDGTDTDFSFHTCLDGRHNRKDVLQAMRHAVAEQIIDCRNAFFKRHSSPRCPYTGEPLTGNNAHVDHVPPDTFAELAARWLSRQGYRHDDVVLVPNADNQHVCEMCDPSQLLSWRGFHESQAKLRVISKTANMSHVRKERVENTYEKTQSI